MHSRGNTALNTTVEFCLNWVGGQETSPCIVEEVVHINWYILCSSVSWWCDYNDVQVLYVQEGDTALIIASAIGHLQVVDRLLVGGAQPDLQDEV